MYRVLALCNTHTSPEIDEFKDVRSFPIIPFLGRYTFLDFTLSNFSNSDIDKMGILVRNNPQNISMHLGNNQSWNKNTKTGFLYTLYDERGILNENYNTDISNLKLNAWVLERAKPQFIVVASCHYLVRLDYREALKFHETNNNDVTIIYKESQRGKELKGITLIKFNKNGFVTQMKENDLSKEHVYADIESYIFSYEYLLRILEHEGKGISFKEAIKIAIETKKGKIKAYPFLGSVQTILTFKDYVDTSLKLLSYQKRKDLFNSNWPIYTRTHDTPPSKICEGSEVTNSFVANGSVIAGKVHSSILSRNVSVEKGAEVDETLIFSEAIIGKNAKIKHAVIERGVVIKGGSHIIGDENHPLYVNKSN